MLPSSFLCVRDFFHGSGINSRCLVLCSCFFLSKIEEKLALLPDDADVGVDGGGGPGHQVEKEAQSLISSCKFSMKLEMIAGARKQVGAAASFFFLLLK